MYQRHEDNKKVVETIPIFEFIQRLIIHIPDKNFKMLRYYGIYSKKSIHHSKLIKKLSDNAIKVRKMLAHRQQRIEMSFGYNPCVCSCGHKMIFIELYGTKGIAHLPP